MITSRFPLGDVSFSAEYFSTLVGEATKQCYGVAAMAPRDLTDRVRSAVRGVDDSAKGVRVTQEEGRLVIELHIAVSYGLNISTAARSISHRVKDEVEQATGLKVAAWSYRSMTWLPDETKPARGYREDIRSKKQ